MSLMSKYGVKKPTKSCSNEKKAVGRPDGGNYHETVRIELNKPIDINEAFKPSLIQIKPMPKDGRKFRCCMCGQEFKNQSGNFPTGGKSRMWQANNGFIPICKTCVETLYRDLVVFYKGNEEHALRHICWMFDWYYNVNTSAMTIAQVREGKVRATLYPSKLSVGHAADTDITYINTVHDEYLASLIINDIDTIKSEDDGEEGSDEDFVVTKEMITTWGKGFTADQYRYLEEEYADWIAKNVCNTKSQEELFRNIVLAQLDVRVVRQNGGKVAEAQKALQDLMNSANILPRQTSENLLADTQTFGTLLKKYEDTDPIPEPAEEWKDVDGIRKYMNAWFRGGLAKALKLKNENSDLYTEALEEYKRYTVTPKQANEQDDSVDTAIFDSDEEEVASEDGDVNGTDIGG